MRCVVTGAAGFIGSQLVQRLLTDGHEVKGIDCFTDYYPKWIKEKNILPLARFGKFSFFDKDINQIDLSSILEDTDYVFHLSAQAGVRSSWGQSFSIYTYNNIEATQRLLEASKKSSIQRFIYASSSSVYGLCPDLPWKETSPLIPYSPYGVSKLAAEHLCSLYHRNYEIPTISLRFFTVYGPGQRPDMAFHKFFKSIAEDRPLTVYGDGRQTRDFTYVKDVVEACISSMDKGDNGETYNIGGGSRKFLNDLIPLFEDICHRHVAVVRENIKKGDVPHTAADIEKAKKHLHYSPVTGLRVGLAAQWNWIKELYRF